MEVISVANIKFAFEDKASAKIIDDISFSTGEYEFVSIIGPSGCGKSTLLRIIAGLIAPTSGRISYYGNAVTEPIKDISFVFQDSALLPWLTNIENVKIGLSSTDLKDNVKNKKALEILKRFELNGFEYAYPNILSGGMKQRVGVARALVSDPKVILMDEPFSSLDELTARSLREEVSNMLKDKSLSLMSVIMVSHNVEEVVELSDKVVILSNKPSLVKEIKKIDLPYPRNRHDKDFQKTVDEVFARLSP